ncbi:MAG TPA: lipid-A-disaccharide synthase [Rhodocyclaceae bacterium]|jgi:lipid-A-disaccharide synthase|nr:lipid-A-disaccharide synthase [Rhodocyclaceae bacterium]
MPVRIAMVAGEASGDQLAAHLIEALRVHLPDAEFYGIGGPRMQSVGFKALWPAEKLAVNGYAEVLKRYRELSGIRKSLLAIMRKDKPDVFIAVDAPDFNLWLEERMKNAGVPAIHFVSPSIWAWRGERIHKIKRAVSRMLALFPFEPEIYERENVPVSYVGHPFADAIPVDRDRAGALERLGLDADGQYIALLPGSRQSELDNMAESFIETGKLLLQRFPKAQLLVPLVTRETRDRFELALWECKAQDLPFKMIFGHARDVLAVADAALVASGTATLEAALLKTPMVVTYKVARMTYRLMKNKGYQPWIGLPNILAGEFVVPEFVQDQATPENMAQAVGNLIVDKVARMQIVEVFRRIHESLRQGTGERAAAAVLPYLLPK